MKQKKSFFVFFAILSILLLTAACGGDTAPTAVTPASTTPITSSNTRIQEGKTMKTASGLEYTELVAGTGAAPKAGDIVSVNYTGTLTNGVVFDSSYKRNQPFQFPLGQGQVIPGWDEGIGLMKIGGKARLTIPPNLGYGAGGAGGVIPPNATLIFDVELMDVKAGAPKVAAPAVHLATLG